MVDTHLKKLKIIPCSVLGDSVVVEYINLNTYSIILLNSSYVIIIQKGQLTILQERFCEPVLLPTKKSKRIYLNADHQQINY
jgi:hypothetical protein